jgi:putative ABC transport system substrate-binding protein
MNRRHAICALLAFGAAAGPLRAAAQPRARLFRIGLLPDCEDAYCGWFHDAMRESGWLEGRDFELVTPGLRWGVEVETAAQRVVSANPDLIYTVGTQYVLAAQRLTRTIPIVFWGAGYPVECGYARSFARPGGNATGIVTYAGTGIWGKLLEILRDAKPGTRRVGVLFNYVPPFHPRNEADLVLRDMRADAQALGVELRVVEFELPSQLAGALKELAAQKPDGALLTTGPGTWPVRQDLLRYALERRWPTISDVRWAPGDELQPLMSYGPSPRLLMRQAASYAVRILKNGAKPGELPIQRPDRFTLIVNLKTAKAIGLTLPQSLLVRADEVIE